MRRYRSMLALLLLWELLPRLGLVRPLLLPPFTAVVREGAGMLWRGELAGDIAVTLGRAGAGLALAALVGIGVGLGMATVRPVRMALRPLIAFFFPTPKIGLYPVLIILFGIGHAAKVGLVFLEAIFPIILATYAGAMQFNPKLIWTARAMGTSPTGLMLRVFLPAALPEILTGLRVATLAALIGVFTAEMVSSADGLGHLMILSARTFATEQMYVALVLISLVGALLDFLLLRFRRWVLAWHAEAGMH